MPARSGWHSASGTNQQRQASTESAGYGTATRVASNEGAGSWLRRATRVLAVLLLAPREARGDELELTLDYTAPPECASESSIRAVVARLVTRSRTEAFSAQVVIDKTETGYLSRIRATSSAERALPGASCDEVVEATAVILALAMSPKNSAPAPVAPAATTAAQDRALAGPEQPASHRSGGELSLKVGISGDSSVLPRPAFGFSGFVGLQSDVWTVQVGGSYFLQQRAALPQDENRGGDLALWTVWPSACGAPFRGRARLELCAGPELGQILGEGFGISSPRHAAALWLGALGAAQLSLGLSSHFRVYAALGAVVRLTPNRPFVLDGIATVHEPRRISGRASLGGEVVF
jgi:hypothetical protein